jgi:hypothetical protein
MLDSEALDYSCSNLHADTRRMVLDGTTKCAPALPSDCIPCSDKPNSSKEGQEGQGTFYLWVLTLYYLEGLCVGFSHHFYLQPTVRYTEAPRKLIQNSKQKKWYIRILFS